MCRHVLNTIHVLNHLPASTAPGGRDCSKPRDRGFVHGAPDSSLFSLLRDPPPHLPCTARAPLQQRLQPALMALAVAVQEGQHITLGHGSPQQPCSHQALPLVGADQADLGQLGKLNSQALLQVLWRGKRDTEGHGHTSLARVSLSRKEE